jgi:isopentenyl-diphosphate Delta-isomerase
VSSQSLVAPLAPERVVLLGPDRRPTGTELKSAVHGADTPLHLAFSCYVFDEDGRVLLTRRALEKKTWPGVWTNTCCGHPSPDESMTDAVIRRLGAELGLAVSDLACALPDFGYRAVDASGVVENEYCPVFTAQVHPESPVRANASEVMDWRWAAWDDLTQAVRLTPFAFSPWAVEQVPLLARAA